MPQLAKGGKWVFGWAIVNDEKTILIPPTAYTEYKFETNEPVVFLKGSRRSGGFGLGKKNKITGSIIHSRIVEEGIIQENMQFTLPHFLAAVVGEKFLVVRGSNYALSFLQKGPIVEEALQHLDVEEFTA